MLENARIDVDPEDWFADHFDNARQILIRHRESWRSEHSRGILSREAGVLERGSRTGAFFAELDLGHISPGWRYLLKQGVPGILHEIEARMAEASDDAARDFFASAARMYHAFLTFMARLEAQARRMAIAFPASADRMEKLSAWRHCRPAHRPRSTKRCNWPTFSINSSNLRANGCAPWAALR